MYPEIQTSDVQAHARLTAWFDQLGADVCDVLADADGRYIVLEDGQRFSDVSAVLRRIMAGVDGWPIPPAGLCVVEERIVILRSLSPMTFFHETGHLLDLALGGGVYLSGIEPKLRRAFANATAFVTPYAASGAAFGSAPHEGDRVSRHRQAVPGPLEQRGPSHFRRPLGARRAAVPR